MDHFGNAERLRRKGLAEKTTMPFHRKPRFLAPSLALLMGLFSLSEACGSTEGVASLEQAVEAQATVLDDAAKRERALDVLERFVPHAESFWRTSDLREPRTGRYDAVGSGVTQPRGAGDIAFAYVTLLAARPDQATFGGVARETLIEHTVESIRHEALTNKLSGATYNRWGNGSWQAALETFGWAFAAHRLWDRLDEDTRTLVQRVVTREANLLLTKPIASGEEGDTGAEDNGWNAPLPALAAVMFPEDPNRAAWETTAIRLALNASSTAADETSSVIVDGQPLGEWMASVNLHPDLTMENHGFFNPIYQQVVHVDIGEAAIAYGEARHPLPEAFSFRTDVVWDQILGRLATDDGDFALTAGQDWVSKDYQHLDYLAILATRFQRVDASVFESRALELIARRQATHTSGSLLGQPQVGYETMLVKRLASLWWNHHLFGPAPQPTADQFHQARAQADGVKEFPHSDFVAARLGKAFVSMSWDRARPLGLVVPHGEPNIDDPIFSYYAPKNLLGSASGDIGPHTCACEHHQFSTAGSIGARRFSMTAFSDGTTLLLDRGQGATFTYALENIPGLIGERPIWSTAGTAVGDLPGTWLNAADRLGMIVRGGAGLRVAPVTSAPNTQLVLTGSIDTGSANRGALLLPLVTHEQTAELDAFVTQPVMPDEWSALTARAADSTVRLAIARWGGPAATELEIGDPRGAPIPEQYAVLDGKKARFTVGLEAPSSRGQTIRFLVDAPVPLRGRQDGPDAAVLRNPGAAPAAVTVTYVTSEGTSLSASRTLAPGEEARARILGSQLVVGGSELEPLTEARSTLSNLLAQIEIWRRDRQLLPPAALRLSLATRGSLTAVDEALEQSQSADPDTVRAAVTSRLARFAIELVALAADGKHIPADVRTTVLASVDSTRTKLDQAVEAFGVNMWVEPAGAAQPGESLPVRVTMANRAALPALDGVVSVNGPEGWPTVAPLAAFTMLPAGQMRTVELNLAVPPTVTPGTTATLKADLGYRRARRDLHEISDAHVTVAPLLAVTTLTPRLPLAPGGMNRAEVRLVNYAARPLELTLAAQAPEGATPEPATQQLTVPASGSLDAFVMLSGAARTTGTAPLNLVATTTTAVQAESRVDLTFFADLARNDVGATWPRVWASSNQASYPATLAVDGNASTFWVSDGTVAGQGPSPENPQMLGLDFGFPTRIGSVTMVPRVNYGPRAYTIEVSEDGATWVPVASIPSAINATITTTFAPVTARQIRLQITGGWDRIQPPRNVQIAALEVRTAP